MIRGPGYRPDENNVLGINYHIESDGTKIYQCTGAGPKYERFYNVWLPSSSYRSIKQDFPWDVFVFDNPEDHERLVRDYPDDVDFYEYIDEDDDER